MSVVVPAYRAAGWIARTLGSVADQTFTSWQCVVVDDGSDDDTMGAAVAAVGADPRFVVVSRENGGVSAARNTGLALVDQRARFVAFVDADDLWHRHALVTLTTALDARPDASGVTGNARRVDEAGVPVDLGNHERRVRGRVALDGRRLRLLGMDEDTDFAALAVSGRIWPPAMGLFRADRVRAVGGFDETLAIGEDWDLYLRLARTGPLVFVDQVIVDYRQHPASATAQDHERIIYELDRVRHKAWLDATNSPAQRRAVVDGWRAVQRSAYRKTLGEAAQALAARRRSALRRSLADAAVLRRTLGGAGPPVPDRAAAAHRLAMVGAVHTAVSRLQRRGR